MVVGPKLTRAQVQEEVELHRQLNHPCIVKNLEAIVDFDRGSDAPDMDAEGEEAVYLVTEFLPNGALRGFIRAAEAIGGFAPQDIRSTLAQVAAALKYLHSNWHQKGLAVVHRDMKPENIVLGAGGHAKLLDFGISEIRHQELGTRAPQSEQSSRGTMPYKSPERVRQLPCGVEDDLWALGMIGVEMATGKRVRVLFDGIPASLPEPEFTQQLHRILLRLQREDPVLTTCLKQLLLYDPKSRATADYVGETLMPHQWHVFQGLGGDTSAALPEGLLPQRDEAAISPTSTGGAMRVMSTRGSPSRSRDRSRKEDISVTGSQLDDQGATAGTRVAAKLNSVAAAAEDGPPAKVLRDFLTTCSDHTVSDVMTGRFILSFALRHGKESLKRRCRLDFLDIRPRDFTVMHVVAAHGKTRCVMLLHVLGVPVNIKNDMGDIPLHFAAWQNCLETADLLLQLGSTNDVNIAGEDLQRTALHWVSALGSPKAAKFLLLRNADPRKVDHRGNTPLHLAAANDRAGVIRVIMANGEHVAISPVNRDGHTPLQLAAYYGRIKAIHQLLRAGAPPDPTPDSKGSPLCSAAARGHADVVRLLLEHGARVLRPDAAGHHAVAVAVHRGKVAILDMLLREVEREMKLDPTGEVLSLDITSAPSNTGADAASPSRRFLEDSDNVPAGRNVELVPRRRMGCLPLCCRVPDEPAPVGPPPSPPPAGDRRGRGSGESQPVARYELPGWVEEDLARGKAVWMYTPAVPQTTLAHAAASRLREDCLAVMLQHGLNPMCPDERSRTPLHSAAASGSVRSAQLLLEAGADPSAQARGGVTPLYEAARNGHTDVVYVLLAAGADGREVTGDGSLALHSAARHGHAACVAALLDPGVVAVDAPDGVSRTPLHWAVSNGHVAVVIALIGRGAQWDLVDGNDESPMQIARRKGHKKLGSWLARAPSHSSEVREWLAEMEAREASDGDRCQTFGAASLLSSHDDDDAGSLASPRRGSGGTVASSALGDRMDTLRFPTGASFRPQFVSLFDGDYQVQVVGDESFNPGERMESVGGRSARVTPRRGEDSLFQHTQAGTESVNGSSLLDRGPSSRWQTRGESNISPAPHPITTPRGSPPSGAMARVESGMRSRRGFNRRLRWTEDGPGGINRERTGAQDGRSAT